MTRAPSGIPHLYTVIMAGGSGTRFWPLSRHLYPKQLLRIMGDETMIQQTMRRSLRCTPADRVLISTTPAQADSIRVQLGEWKDALKDNYVIEPEARNTAPAIALAATEALQRDPDAIMLMVPADHAIHKDERFDAAVKLGAALANDGYLVTFGVPPSRPETGYGYIQPNRQRKLAGQGKLSGYAVKRFVEKPDEKTAEKYLKDGHYYWNSGIFIWRASTVLEEIARHQPTLAKGMKAVAALGPVRTVQGGAAAIYRKLTSISIDHGVMERSSKAAMIPVDFRWSDVGNWSSLEEVSPRDKAGNVVSGNVIDFGSRNSILYADQRVVATIGLDEMVVVDTPDATLICPKNKSQDVKKIVEVLKQKGAPEHLEHKTVIRPWGTYTVLDEGHGYKVKRVTVNPGGRLSLQMHHKRSEHWVVIAGTARVTCGERVFDLQVGESTGIPRETKHRLENPGTTPLHIIEVQDGPYLGEDDIVRFQDDYERPVRGKGKG
jgi:mannose-1-phosphate guanylyltransferase/mannose-6-phosphate isomerase